MVPGPPSVSGLVEAARTNGSSLLHNQMLDTWVVQERLGSGGMGTVYRCHNRDARRIQAAIKVLDPRLATSGSVRRRFVREAELLFELDHPHIVKVRNIRMDASPPFIEMAFVDGASLGEHLEEGPLTPGAAARLVGQIASALAHCHQHGVQHRDVKPTNILVQGNHATLVDFGIAVESGGTVSNGVATVGSLSYTPPEWGSDGSDPKLWDAYSLGIVLFESLTGRMAFPAKPGAGIREEIVRQIDIRRGIRNLDPGEDHPDELRELCRRLTETAPETREADLGKVAAQLAAFSRDMDDCSLPERARKPGTTTDTIALPNDLDEFSGVRAGLSRGAAGGTPAWTRAPTGEMARGADTTAPEPPIEPAASLPPPERTRTTSAVRLALAVVGLVGLAYATGVLLDRPDDGAPDPQRSVLTPEAPAPQRPVIIRVEGDALGLPVQVRVDGDAVDTGTPLVLGVGDHELLAELGSGCADGPGPQCVTASRTVALVEGVGPADVSISLPELSPVPLAFAPPLPDGARVRIDDGPWAQPAELAPVFGGAHSLVAQLGTCPDAPCGGGCPTACTEATLELTLPLTAEAPHPIALVLEAPSPPVRAATAGAAMGSGRRVTVGQFSRFLAGSPEHQPAAMRASGSVPQGYLRGWDGPNPPAALSTNASVTRVSPAVASAVCRGRGGLHPFDAPPQSFAEEGATDHEYRKKGDRVVLIRWDGQEVLTPAGAVSPTAAVRCRR